MRVPRDKVPHFPYVIGRQPVWADIGKFNDRYLAFHLVQSVGEGSHTEYGWGYKILWLVALDYRYPVTITGGRIGGNRPLWFQIQRQQPSRAPKLDPLHPPIPDQDGKHNFPSYVFVPKAGCYYIQARWRGGSWRTTFAAGR